VHEQVRSREAKWQRAWKDARLFEPEPKPGQEKFFCTFPYPYVNGLPHVGHLFSIMRVEAFARYHRHRGKNVLFPQGFHATGSPIVAAANRVKEGEEKQIKILKEFGVPEKDIPKFAKPEHWIEYFVPRYRDDLTAAGLSIDWRRSFHTTSLNPQYDAFVRWQFRTLKERGHVVQGSHPVVWCPKDKTPVGDHDRLHGEGETVKEFLWGKFRLRDSDLILLGGTTRPDAFLGQTNMWIDPHATYAIVAVNGEKWVVGKKAISKIEEQYTEAKQIGEIPASELIGKWVKGPAVDYEIYIVPAHFIDANVGSGLVYSALEDPVDLLEIRTLQSNPQKIAEYGLELDIVANLRPISIIEVSGMGRDLGDDIMKEYGVASYKDRKKVEEAKGELNRRVFRKGVMRKNCGKYAGMTVPDAQAQIIKDTLASNDAVMFYELTGRVVCRCQTEAIVKLVSNQWFIAYDDERWKQRTREALALVRLYPQKARAQFEHVVGWLRQWACTREYGLGTRLPWDEQWLIESLSDSTIYMAYYTVAHIIRDVPAHTLDTAFFDWLFLGKGNEPEVPGAAAMRKEFLYWYPMDFRNSGKDLIQNHLTFMLFNHCAIFPKEHWPRGIGVNGWVTVNGQKMSKSLGNVIPVRALVEEFGADATRITILNGGEGMDDPNWDSNFARGVLNRFEGLMTYAHQLAHLSNKGGDAWMDRWLAARSDELAAQITAAMEATNFRTAIQLALFEYAAMLRWYRERAGDGVNSALLRKAFEHHLIMLAPFVPHACEQAWETLGNPPFVSAAPWPERDAAEAQDPDVLHGEAMIQDIAEHIRKSIAGRKPTKILLSLSAKWKRKAFTSFDRIVSKTRNPEDVLELMQSRDAELRSEGEELRRLVLFLAKSRTPGHVMGEHEERRALDAAKGFLERISGSQIAVLAAGEGDGKRKDQGLPGKPAIEIV
jgi:leucyl-tRNA synthetase